jgi:uncharacterized membrane protein YeaQ/YmgE (transglycosylase-associated protein family)
VLLVLHDQYPHHYRLEQSYPSAMRGVQFFENPNGSQTPIQSPASRLPSRTPKSLIRRKKAIGIISWIVIGAFAGLVARRIVPGPDPGRSIITIILGMAGASLGGFVFGVLGGGVTSFEVRSLPVATLGAVLLLCLYGLIARRTA